MPEEQVKPQVIHHGNEDDAWRLEETFAQRKEEGWVIPDWVKLYRETCLKK
jgi:hypothetical protein